MTRYTITVDFEDDATGKIKQFVAEWLSKLMSNAHMREVDIKVSLGTENGEILLYPREVTS